MAEVLGAVRRRFAARQSASRSAPEGPIGLINEELGLARLWRRLRGLPRPVRCRRSSEDAAGDMHE